LGITHEVDDVVYACVHVQPLVSPQIRKHLLYPELTATTYKGIFWRCSYKLFATHQTLCTFKGQIPRWHCWQWVRRCRGHVSGNTHWCKPCRDRMARVGIGGNPFHDI